MCPFSTTVVLVFTVLGIYWEYITVSPDFLGSARNLICSNWDLNKRQLDIDGHDKTKAMADMKGMLQDVARKDDVGNIALAPYTEGNSRLSRSRSYK